MAKIVKNGALGMLVIGVTWSVLASATWIWIVVRGEDLAAPTGMLTGGILVCIVALVWMYRDRRGNDSDQTV